MLSSCSRLSEVLIQDQRDKICILKSENLKVKKEEVRILKGKGDSLITQRDQAILKGAQALQQFQETILRGKTERDRFIGENEALVTRENMIRSRLGIESDDDFQWALSVVENAIVGLATRATERNHLQQIEDLSKKLKSVILSLSARDSKYLRLKEKLVVSVSNTMKSALREQNEQVRSNADTICTRYGHPLLNFNFPEVLANEEEIDISSSEKGYEEEEIEDDHDVEDGLQGRSADEGLGDGEEIPEKRLDEKRG
ncbi:hypothetical protein C5167_008580 [Papaver somniferum]|uniref:Uncharacterized protein n=1 Tax=Papaver somniferum TaxID=3469 RepID=A0A4Y7JUY9_PAPSO|nr:hypothetical protein C5167_008580 [Papaver somniferum]